MLLLSHIVTENVHWGSAAYSIVTALCLPYLLLTSSPFLLLLFHYSCANFFLCSHSPLVHTLSREQHVFFCPPQEQVQEIDGWVGWSLPFPKSRPEDLKSKGGMKIGWGTAGINLPAARPWRMAQTTTHNYLLVNRRGNTADQGRKSLCSYMVFNLHPATPWLWIPLWEALECFPRCVWFSEKGISHQTLA